LMHRENALNRAEGIKQKWNEPHSVLHDLE
jgi:hypothetical protein